MRDDLFHALAMAQRGEDEPLRPPHPFRVTPHHRKIGADMGARSVLLMTGRSIW